MSTFSWGGGLKKNIIFHQFLYFSLGFTENSFWQKLLHLLDGVSCFCFVHIHLLCVLIFRTCCFHTFEFDILEMQGESMSLVLTDCLKIEIVKCIKLFECLLCLCQGCRCKEGQWEAWEGTKWTEVWAHGEREEARDKRTSETRTEERPQEDSRSGEKIKCFVRSDILCWSFKHPLSRAKMMRCGVKA